MARLTRETAIIETQADAFRASERQPLCRFYEADELNHDLGAVSCLDPRAPLS